MTFEKTLKVLCLENARLFEQDRIQKEYEKEQEYLKTCYEKNKDKIEQIREIIIQNSLEGKVSGTISIPLTFIQDDYNSEGKSIINWFDHIGVKIYPDDFSQLADFYPKMGSIAKQFKYGFQE